MGIRIAKSIGYGLPDIIEDDPRINPLGYLGKETEKAKDKCEVWDAKGFLTYYLNHIEFPIYRDEVRNIDLWDSVLMDDEDGEFFPKNTLLISPSWQRDWQRYDDIIDYLENPFANTCKILNCGIWPYTGRFTDLRDYSDITDIGREFWFNLRSADELVVTMCATSKKIKQFKAHYDLAAHYAKIMGFETVEEARKFIIPRVPEEIEEFCKWLCLFNDDNTIFEMRPMICTYWR